MLFVFNALFIASNGTDSRVSSLTADQFAVSLPL